MVLPPLCGHLPSTKSIVAVFLRGASLLVLQNFFSFATFISRGLVRHVRRNSPFFHYLMDGCRLEATGWNGNPLGELIYREEESSATGWGRLTICVKKVVKHPSLKARFAVDPFALWI